MKETIVHEGPRVEFLESKIPKPASNEVTIKVAVAGIVDISCKDLKHMQVVT